MAAATPQMMDIEEAKARLVFHRKYILDSLENLNNYYYNLLDEFRKNGLMREADFKTIRGMRNIYGQQVAFVDILTTRVSEEGYFEKMLKQFRSYHHAHIAERLMNPEYDEEIRKLRESRRRDFTQDVPCRQNDKHKHPIMKAQRPLTTSSVTPSEQSHRDERENKSKSDEMTGTPSKSISNYDDHSYSSPELAGLIEKSHDRNSEIKELVKNLHGNVVQETAVTERLSWELMSAHNQIVEHKDEYRSITNAITSIFPRDGSYDDDAGSYDDPSKKFGNGASEEPNQNQLSKDEITSRLLTTLTLQQSSEPRETEYHESQLYDQAINDNQRPNMRSINQGYEEPMERANGVLADGHHVSRQPIRLNENEEEGIAAMQYLVALGGTKDGKEHYLDADVFHPRKRKFSRKILNLSFRENFAAVAKGSTVFLFGGRKQNNTLTDVESYNFETKESSTLPDMPMARDHLSVVEYEGNFYVIAGCDKDGQATDTVFRLAVNMRKRSSYWWDIMPPLNEKRFGHVAIVFRGLAFVIGGTVGQRDHSVEVNDLSLDGSPWQQYVKTIHWRKMSAVAADDKSIIVVGGYRKNDGICPAFLNTVERNSPMKAADGNAIAPSQWEDLNPIPLYLSKAALAYYGGRFWLLGGNNGKKAKKRTFLLVENKWKYFELMNKQRESAVALVVTIRKDKKKSRKAAAAAAQAADGYESITEYDEDRWAANTPEGTFADGGSTNSGLHDFSSDIYDDVSSSDIYHDFSSDIYHDFSSDIYTTNVSGYELENRRRSADADVYEFLDYQK